MRVLLEPFRQHERLDMVLPEIGLIQLKGRSGVGKSTVFDAIFEAIIGSGDATDAVPWGGARSKVELWLGSMHIKRTRGPHTLTLTCPDGEFKDEAAQKRIIDLLGGLDEHAFLASSYVRQGLAGSLLSLGAADQLRFVQRLAAGAQDPEIIRKRIQEMVARRSAELASTERELATAKEAITAAEANLARAAFIDPAPPMDPFEMDRLVLESESVAKSLKVLEEKASKIKALLRNPAYEVIRTIDALKTKNEAVIANNILEIKKLESEETDLAKRYSHQIVTDSIQLKSRLAAKRTRLEVIGQMNTLAAEVAARYGSADKPAALLDDRAAELKRLTDAGQGEYAALSLRATELLQRSEPDHCPACAAPLCVSGGKIELAQELPDDHAEQVERAAKERDDYRAKHEGWHAERNEISSLQSKIALLKGRLVDDTAPEAKTLEDVQRLLTSADETISEQKALETSKHRVLLAKTALIAKNKSLADEIAKAEATIAGTSLPPEDQVRAQANAADAEASGMADKLTSYNEARNMQALYINACHARDKAKAVYDERFAALEVRKTDNSLKEIKAVVANARLAAAKRLRERSDQAAVMAIELTLEEINQNAKTQLDRMFPLDGTTIRIKNISQNQDGDQKAKFSTEIFHKGKAVKKLSSLSGGERSRAYMAFQLALTEMYKSPFLLVDEGFAGLPEEQVKECLELLREASSNRLILVIEHGAPESLFDQVVPINDEELSENA